jgi:hypothetical protein
MAGNANRCGRVLRSAPLGLLLICILGLPGAMHAANNCAWLNEATASGLLGGDAAGEVTAVAGQPTVCEFTQTAGGVKRTLRISVEIAADPHTRLVALEQQCGANSTPLKAIGNEAVACALSDRKVPVGEQVLGRVRDQVFTITIASTLKNDPVLYGDALQSKIYTAAEQVAGNLF